MARRLFHATEVGLCELRSTYGFIGSLTITGGLRDISLSRGGGSSNLGDVNAVVMPTVHASS